MVSNMKIFIWLLIMIIFTNCMQDEGLAKYDALQKKELSSGKRVDSIFFGMYFGMTSKQFFTYCWEMNKKGIFTDGENNMYVLYKLNNNELKYSASMNFYPDFYKNKIYKMRVSFQYNGWSPWNKQLYADNLMPNVLALYKTWYREGNPFIQINDKEKGTIYVKVDGNRRITIGRYDDLKVKVDYTDLLAEQQMKNENAK